MVDVGYQEVYAMTPLALTSGVKTGAVPPAWAERRALKNLPPFRVMLSALDPMEILLATGGRGARKS